MFDSTKPRDHARARVICAACPLVEACLNLALSVSRQTGERALRGPDGTWAGLLWVNGEVAA